MGFMSKSIECDLCHKPASVHLTQIVNNQIKKVDLCEDCARKKGLHDPAGFSLADLLSKGLFFESGKLPESRSECEVCGYQIKHFKSNGRLGCSHCYEKFKTILTPMLESLHIGLEHKGKVPKRASKSRIMHERIETMKEKMQQAIKQEAFEQAAQLRDEIQILKKELGVEGD